MGKEKGMQEPFSRYLAIVGFVLCVSPIFAPERATMRVHFFKAGWEKERADLHVVSILKAATHPAPADLKAKAAVPAAERTTAALDAILELKNTTMNGYKMEILSPKGVLIGEIPLNHRADAFRIFGDNLFLRERNDTTYCQYNVVDK